MNEDKSSTHKCEVVPVVLEKHPNADSLSIVRVFGYQVCVRTDAWQNIALGAFVVPDSIVDVSRPEFAFLSTMPDNKGKTHVRIRAKKLRGEPSYGLLIPAPDGAKEGDDVAELLGIERYVPPEERNSHGAAQGYVSTKATPIPPPDVPFHIPDYHVDAFQRYARDAFIPGEMVYVSEKIDGCLRNNTKITMSDYSQKKIADIKVGEEVLGYENNRIVASVVTNVFHNDKTLEWMEIRIKRCMAVSGNHEAVIVCTPNHQFFINGQYKRADELTVGDHAIGIRYDADLNPIQKQILLGKMLGDGCYYNAGHTADISFGHKQDHSQYVDWCLQGLGDVGMPTSPTVSGYRTEMVRGRTTRSHFIKKEFEDFFQRDSNTKHIPESVVQKLTPIALAFWYMDDGSLNHKDGQEDWAVFSTCCFDFDDHVILLKALKKFDIDGELQTSKGFLSIRLNSDEAEKLFLLIAPYVPVVMQYKLPQRYHGFSSFLPLFQTQYKPSAPVQIISKITRLQKTYEKYDIETTTHNFFANKILVHNSNSRFLWDGQRMHIGSHHRWLEPDGTSMWHKILTVRPEIVDFCKSNPNVVLFGEVVGFVQDLHYGMNPGEINFVAFDVMDNGKWLDVLDMVALVNKYGLYTPPRLGILPYDFENLMAMAEGPSLYGKALHYREGCVVRPLMERTEFRIGRVQLKIVSMNYLEAGGKEKPYKSRS